VHLTNGKACKSCGSHLCLECSDKVGYCEDCQEPIPIDPIVEEIHEASSDDYIREDVPEDSMLNVNNIHSARAIEEDLNRQYYADAMGKAVNFTPEELKEMEDGWKFYDKIMGKPINLAVEYKKITENPEEYPHIKTIDDFFDEYDVPTLARTDFAVAAIFKQIKQNIDSDLAKEHVKSLTENIDPDSPAVNPAYDLEEEDA